MTFTTSLKAQFIIFSLYVRGQNCHGHCSHIAVLVGTVILGFDGASTVPLAVFGG